MAPRIPAIALSQSPLRLRCASLQSPWSLFELHRARSIAQSYLRKVDEAEKRWAIRAEQINKGELPHVWDVLEDRGYIKDVAGNVDRIKEVMRIKRTGAYVGIDPTADSLHIGHLLPMMPLFWLWFHGYPAVTIVGGATARIGDPTGRLESREIMASSELTKNITKMHYQIKRLWLNVERLREKYEYPEDWAAKHFLFNNNMWMQNLSFYEFTKRLARFSRIGPMLSRDTVKRKMTEGDGMSLSEFMYPLFQGWDFWHLYNKLGVQMQIGGSDQYGNIVAGIDALKTIRDSEPAPHERMSKDWQHEPMGFTVPLLTDSSGAKFGKSAGNAVWLDEYKTSPFELYGYFMRRTDDEVEKLLKMFTFMPSEHIKMTMSKHEVDPSKRLAQHSLAFEVLSLVHGSQRAVEEAQQHQFRFGGTLPHFVKEPSLESGHVTPNNAPRSDIELPRSILKASPARLLFAAGLASSSSDGQRLVAQQGAYVAGQPGQMKGLVPGNLAWTPMKMWYPEETNKFVIDDKLLILRKGKHNVRIVELVDDAEWEASGRIYPGQPFTGKIRRLKEALVAEKEAQGETISEEDLNEMIFDEEEAPVVANNPDIELPTKREVRERTKQKKAEKAQQAGGNAKP